MRPPLQFGDPPGVPQGRVRPLERRRPALRLGGLGLGLPKGGDERREGRGARVRTRRGGEGDAALVLNGIETHVMYVCVLPMMMGISKIAAAEGAAEGGDQTDSKIVIRYYTSRDRNYRDPQGFFNDWHNNNLSFLAKSRKQARH